MRPSISKFRSTASGVNTAKDLPYKTYCVYYITFNLCSKYCFNIKMQKKIVHIDEILDKITLLHLICSNT